MGAKQEPTNIIEELFAAERILREAAIIYASWEKAAVGQGATNHESLMANRNDSRATLRKAAVRYGLIARRLEEPTRS